MHKFAIIVIGEIYLAFKGSRRVVHVSSRFPSYPALYFLLQVQFQITTSLNLT